MKTLLKESFVSIKKNFKRFISILLIVLLGVGFFAGIRVTSPNMKKTLDKYYKDTNFMDFNLLSTWGIDNNDIKSFQEHGYIVEPSYQFDAIVESETEEVIKVISYNEKDKINKLILLDGRLPQKNNECVIEQNQYTKSHKIGDKIIVNDDTLYEKELIITGIIKSPIYTSLERGTTKLLAGKIKFYMYVPVNNFNIDYYTNLYIKLDNNYSVFSTEYDNLLQKENNKLKKITSTLGDNRYKEELEKAESKIKDSEEDLLNAKRKYESEVNEAESSIKKAKNDYQNNLNKINTEEKRVNKEFSDNEKKLTQAKKELFIQQENLLIKEQEFNENKKIYMIELEKLQSSKTQLEISHSEVEEKILTLKKEIEFLDNEINNGINVEENLALKEEKESTLNVYQETYKNVTIQLETINNSLMQINNILQESDDLLQKSKAKLETTEKTISDKETSLNTAKEKFNKQIINSRKQLNIAKSKINNSEKTLSNKKKEATEKFSDAEDQIKRAKNKLNELQKPTWYILDHDSNLGFYQYREDTLRIKNIGKVFPVVFFVVAILICLTSMTRMVEEERSQLGTLKALGYNNAQIVSKYVIYALTATIIGSIIGVCIGFKILPTVIFNMYSMMYNVGNIVTSFDIKYALSGTIIAVLCTLFATLTVCYKDLRETPASLMRPKSPKAGKRVLLEKVKFIWKKLNFIKKVTVRNVFRYKKRFLMTIIGIAGCTGLIVAGFGLRDCITGMVPNQYEKVFKYQLEVTFKDDVSISDKNKETERINNIDHVNKSLKALKESITLNNKTTNQTIQLVVPFDNIDDFVSLSNRKNGTKYELNDKIIITEKIAKLLNLSVGDNLEFSGENKYNGEIGAITENYLYHYIYMPKNMYDRNYYNTLFINTDNLTEKEEVELANEIKKNNYVSNVSFNSSMKNVFNSTMENFSYVAGVLIISAGLLAFVVLYNLSNVNISERRRELATIKVLGFYDKEVYDYIGRETTILTIIGMIIGLVVGRLLTTFIIKTCELDPIMFNDTIKLSSYVISLVITIVFTLLVNITTYFALKKIDMIESLKSVE